jgi:Tfp pilus tip-associated adhesin PilY1
MARTGEKVLSESITFAGTAFFTSYVPNGNPNTCGVDIGAGYLYALDVLTGEGKFDEDRDIPLKHGGIAAPPVIIYTKDESGGDGSSKTKPVLCVGTECMEPPEEAQLLNKTYWREEH